MSENTAMAIMIIARCMVAIVCVVAAYGAMRDGKDGWGWLIFLAVVTVSYSVKLGDCK